MKIEETLYQTKNRSNQDPLNFPIKLNNKLAHLASQTGVGNARPTQQAIDFKKEITARIDEQLDAWEKLLREDIAAFNQLVREKGVDAVIIKSE